ncbi:MAG: tRNA-dihydrouridine synthase family protein [Lachnospiraceae bacterium]|nr:tRNA-dihydrouridine synthase family protein [Lachnospiraceae bacterium]
MNIDSITFAPLEGVTTYYFRQVYKEFFGGIDMFYTPFLGVAHSHNFMKRDKKEYLPFQEDTIPQILTNKVEDFVWAAKTLQDVGYSEINLNMGCPSGTVVSKGRGSGMLGDTVALSKFFDGVFESIERLSLPALSVKTRVGLEEYDETPMIAKVLAGFPFSEIIVHARLRADFYKKAPNPESFGLIRDAILAGPYGESVKIAYNGDLFSCEDVERFSEAFPEVRRIMLGRGLLRNPFLAMELKGLPVPEDRGPVLISFLERIFEEYSAILSGEKDVMFKMKDLLIYMTEGMEKDSKPVKAMKKARNRSELFSAIYELYR